MFADWDDYINDDEVLDLVKRYHDMRCNNMVIFFDLCEYEIIIDYYLNEYNYQEAIIAIKLALVQHPYSLSLKLKHIQVLIETGKPARALSIIRSIEEIDQTNEQIFLLKGIALNLTGKYPEALRCFNKSIRLCNEGKDEIAYSIAQSLIQINQFYAANKYLLLSHRHNDNNVLTLYDLAMNYERLDLPEKSIQYYLKYLDVDPFSENVWCSLGLLYIKTHRFAEAIEAFDFAVAINPNYYTAYFNKADVLINRCDHAGAIELYLQVIEQDPANTRAMCRLGDCYEEIEKFAEAIKSYNRAISCCKSCSDAWFGKGLVFLKLKKYNQSLAAVKKALQSEPGNADYWFMLGEIFSRLRRFAHAVDAYRKAVQINPYDHEAWLACAQILFRKKRICDAIDILGQSYKHIHENPTLHYRLAAYHTYQQDYKNAIKYFERGLELNYTEHQEMFQLFPKTREHGFFYNLIEKHLHTADQNIKN